MSKWDRPLRYDVVKRGLKKLGLDYDVSGSKHDSATCPETRNKTGIPRPKSKHKNELSKYTVGSICEFLIANGYKEADIKKAFKIR